MNSPYSVVSFRRLLGIVIVVLCTCPDGQAAAQNPVSEVYFQEDTRVKTKKEEGTVVQKPEIKEVPKSRKQMKPVIVKPKIKPIKIVRPKIKRH